MRLTNGYGVIFVSLPYFFNHSHQRIVKFFILTALSISCMLENQRCTLLEDALISNFIFSNYQLEIGNFRK